MRLAQQNPEFEEESTAFEAEFDHIADDYYEMLRKSIVKTGELPEYYTECKIADLSRAVGAMNLSNRSIVDFGSGVGSSIPYFRKYFPHSVLNCVDVSARSIRVAQDRFPGEERFVLIEKKRIPLEDASQDIVFSACVFHHIPHEEHVDWFKELRRITRPGGLLMIHEHNPLNPIMVRAVKAAPMDVNAHLIRAGAFRKNALAAGWAETDIVYRQFFPRAFARLRPLEKRLGWLWLGAQYYLLARCPPDAH